MTFVTLSTTHSSFHQLDNLNHNHKVEHLRNHKLRDMTNLMQCMCSSTTHKQNNIQLLTESWQEANNQNQAFNGNKSVHNGHTEQIYAVVFLVPFMTFVYISTDFVV